MIRLFKFYLHGLTLSLVGCIGVALVVLPIDYALTRNTSWPLLVYVFVVIPVTSAAFLMDADKFRRRKESVNSIRERRLIKTNE